MFTRATFSNAIVSKALLTDSEINQLINAAPTTGVISTNERSQQGRIGE